MTPYQQSEALNNVRVRAQTLLNFHLTRYKPIADHSEYGEECQYAKKTLVLHEQSQKTELVNLLESLKSDIESVLNEQRNNTSSD